MKCVTQSSRQDLGADATLLEDNLGAAVDASHLLLDVLLLDVLPTTEALVRHSLT